MNDFQNIIIYIFLNNTHGNKTKYVGKKNPENQ